MKVRLWWLFLSFASGFLLAMWASEMGVHWRNEELHVAAPKLHFLSGPSLTRLKNGTAVPFDFQLQLWAESRTNLIGRSVERFVVSYDVWEEKYSVTKLRGSLSARENKIVSNLTANAAESWCVDNIALPAAGLRADQPFFVRLEIRSVDPKRDTGLVGESGVSLSRLVELLSHPASPEQQKWAVEAGPLKLSDLRRSPRGS